MFCKKCGKELADNAAFCAECGAEVAPAASEPQVSNEMQPDAFISLNTEGEAPVRKKKWLIPTLAAAGVLLVAVAVGVTGYILDWFGNDDSPAKAESKTSEEKNTDANANDIGEKLDSFGNAVNDWFDEEESGSAGYEGEVRLIVGEDLMAIISEEMDMSWLSEIFISYDMSNEGLRSSVDLGIGIADTTITSMEYVLDKETLEMWLSIPDVSDQAVYFDLSGELMGYGSDSSAMLALAAYDILPSWDSLQEPMLTYVESFFNSFDSVEETKEVMELEGISQELTVLKAEMKQEVFYNTLIDLLEQIKQDEAFKTCIQEMEAAYGGNVALYEEIISQIDTVVKEVEQILEEGDFDDANKVYLTTYLDNKDKVVGREIRTTYEGEEEFIFSNLTVVQSNEFAVELNMADQLVICGSGEVGKTMDGIFVLSVEDEEYMEIELIDYAYDAEFATGKILITPLEAMMEDLLESFELEENVQTMIQMMSFVIEAEMTGTKEDNKTSIVLKAAGVEFFTLEISGKLKEPEAISIPEDVVDAQDEEAALAWSESLDSEEFLLTVMQRLVEAGMPEEYLLGFGYSGNETEL